MAVSVSCASIGANAAAVAGCLCVISHRLFCVNELVLFSVLVAISVLKIALPLVELKLFSVLVAISCLLTSQWLRLVSY